MPKFRKKPVVIEAWRLGTVDEMEAVCIRIQELGGTCSVQPGDPTDGVPPYMRVVTLEGRMEAQRGDWIIRGVKDEFYPCKPDIFAVTYDPVEE